MLILFTNNQDTWALVRGAVQLSPDDSTVKGAPLKVATPLASVVSPGASFSKSFFFTT